MITLDLEICLEVDMLATGSAGGSPSEGQGPACEANTTVSQQPQDDECRAVSESASRSGGGGAQPPPQWLATLQTLPITRLLLWALDKWSERLGLLSVLWNGIPWALGAASQLAWLLP